MSGTRRAYAALVFVNCMWGFSFIASKHAMNAGFSPMTLAFVRYVFAALALVPLAAAAEKKKFRLRRTDILPMLLSGLTGITVYYFFEYQGIRQTTTVNASLILAAIPILTMLADAIFMRARLTSRQIIGSAVSFGGVALIVVFSGGEGERSLMGDLMILGASLAWVCYIFVSRRLRQRYSSLSMNAWQALAGVVTLFPLALTEQSQWQPVPWDGWACALALALVCSALCYYLYGNALYALTPLASAIFINLIPLCTIIGGVALLHEPVSLPQLLGGALIIGSIFLVNATQRKAVQASAPSQAAALEEKKDALTR